MKDIDAVSLSKASDGGVFLTIRKGNGYTDNYHMEPREAQFLFSEFGTVLKQIGENND